MLKKRIQPFGKPSGNGFELEGFGSLPSATEHSPSALKAPDACKVRLRCKVLQVPNQITPLG